MANSNYTRVRFGAGPLSADKLNRLADNTEYLYEKMVNGGYYALGFNKDTSVRIQGFIVDVPTAINNVSRYNNVYYPKPFTVGCIPVVTVTHMFTEAIGQFVGVKGIDGGLFPNSLGFRIETFGPPTEYGDEYRGSHKWSVIALGY